MPDHIRLIGRYGNALAALLFGLFAIGMLSSHPEASLFFSMLCALAVFNLYVVEHCSRLLSEEEWLKSEIRKVELRHQLSELEHSVPHAGLPGARQDA